MKRACTHGACSVSSTLAGAALCSFHYNVRQDTRGPSISLVLEVRAHCSLPPGLPPNAFCQAHHSFNGHDASMQPTNVHTKT